MQERLTLYRLKLRKGEAMAMVFGFEEGAEAR